MAEFISKIPNERLRIAKSSKIQMSKEVCVCVCVCVCQEKS